jgi:hypothetical protein
MTSRREFFRLLAAAPLVAPIIARAATEASQTFTASFGMVSGESAWIHPHIRYSAMMRRLLSVDEIRRLEGLPPLPAATPNRLYGAQINADGDAV